MPGEYYHPLYLTVLTILTFVLFSRYQKGNIPKSNDSKLFFLFAVIIALFIGFRPDWYGFTDSRNYIRSIESLEGYDFSFNFDADNVLFDNLLVWIGCNSLGWTLFFLIIAFIYFVGMWIACNKMFPKDTFAAYLVCLAAFSTFSYATNGIKAGAAASLFLIAIAYRDKKFISLIFLLLSLGFHHSMVMPLAAYLFASLCKNPKIYFVLWFLSLLVALLHITFFQNLFAGMTDEQGAGYLMSSGTGWGGKEGFRADFVIYSSMPVLVGWTAIFRKNIQSVKYNFILNIYLITNSIWMLCMYANFTNRIAYLSWSMYPIVLIYPFLNENFGNNRYRTFSYVMLLHLLFTLFMAIIYY